MSYSILQGDCRETLAQLADKSVQTCITSPPYFGLRDYGHDGQIGLEQTPQEFVAELVAVFREVRRVLRDDGTVWLNLGDSYAAAGKNRTEGQAVAKTGLSGGLASQCQSLRQQNKIVGGLKEKDLIGIPWRVALALQDDGWYLRQDIIWHKPNPMPESVTDRCTKAHEYIFLLSKSPKYYFDNEAIQEKGVGREKYFGSDAYSKGSGRNDSGSYNDEVCLNRNKRSVWTVSTQPYAEAHFATFPPALITPCILAGSRPGDLVLDPFNGSGTTGQVALQWNRQYVGCELNPDYIALTHKRLARLQLQMFAA